MLVHFDHSSDRDPSLKILWSVMKLVCGDQNSFYFSIFSDRIDHISDNTSAPQICPALYQIGVSVSKSL